MRKHLLSFLLILFAPFAFSQEFQTLYKQLSSAYEKEDYLAAKKLIPATVARAEKEIKDSTDKYSNLSILCGNVHFSLQEYQEAAKHYRGARDRSKAAFGEEDELFALATFNLARVYTEVGRYAEAEPLYIKALPPLAKAYGQSSVEYTRLFRSLGQLYIDMGRWAEAESMMIAVTNYFKEKMGQANEEYHYALASVGIIFQHQRKYYEAEDIFRSLINYYRQVPDADPENFSTLLNNMGELYRTMGRFTEAEPYFLECYGITKKLEKQQPLASAVVLNNLSLLYKALGRYPEAEQKFKESIRTYRANGMSRHPDYTNPLNNLGDLFRIMGRTQEAYEAFNEVISIRKELLGEDHVNYANALNNMALVQMEIKNHEEAEKLLLQCRSIYGKLLGKNDRFYANCSFNLAMNYRAMGKFDQAEPYYLEAIGIIRDNFGENNEKYATYLQGLAGFYFAKGKTNEAIQTIERTLTILKEQFSDKHYEYITSELSLVNILMAQGRFREAQPYCLHAIRGYSDLIENYLPVLSEREKLQFYNTVFIPLETIKSFAITYARKKPRDDHRELFSTFYDFQLLSKSMLLSEQSKTRMGILAGSDTSLTRLYKLLGDKRSAILECYRLSKTELESKGINLRNLEKEANAIDNELSVKFANLKKEVREKATWQDIKAKLAPGEAAVEMVQILNSSDWMKDTSYYAALIVTPKSEYPSLVIINKGEELDTKYLQDYRKAISSQKQESESYKRFWKPLEAALDGSRKVYFSADGSYQQVNLNSLYNERTGKYLLEEKEIVLVTNTRDLLTQPAEREEAPPTAELFGYPDYEYTATKKNDPAKVTASLSRYGFSYLSELPGTKVEVDTIARLLKNRNWKVNEYLGAEASESKIKGIANPKVLHIATHGFFLKNRNVAGEKILGFQADKALDNPLLRSGIILAGAAAIARDSTADTRQEDGILTAYEAAALRLEKTDLVVLSACETGLGEVAKGQGVYGLQRSFFVAGARSLIMSLWVVDDEATKELMTTFYETWLQNPTPSNRQPAFRTAQLKLRQKYPSPYFWGAFIMIGK